jgi:two-component system response regulator (stage 0 sporulation protein F)
VGKILVVDDQFGIRRLLVETFKEDQHEVEMAEDGAEALRLFIAFEPDLILMDMRMPGMDGIETLEQIRALGCRVAVIMMTAYEDIHNNIEQAKDLGILYYVDKPFDLFELRERVKEILNSLGTINTIS